MSAKAGRKVLVYYTPPGATDPIVVPALKAKSIKLNKELIDITTDDSNGWRELLTDSGTRSVDIELEGLVIDRSLLERWDNEEHLTLKIVIPGATAAGAQFDGDFALASADIKADMEDAVQATTSFQSTGVITIGAVS
jgi:TP901-1 family phage major tail protein